MLDEGHTNELGETNRATALLRLQLHERSVTADCLESALDADHALFKIDGRPLQAEGFTYDPRRLQGVTLYREEDRAFAVGDRVQLTAPNREHHLANRELGAIEQIQAKGELRLRLDSDRTVALNLREHPHLDYGYAVTSHGSQGQTADRVLVHIDLERT